MGVVYEPRQFLNDGIYPSLEDDDASGGPSMIDTHHVDEPQFTDADVSELAAYNSNTTTAASLIEDHISGAASELAPLAESLNSPLEGLESAPEPIPAPPRPIFSIEETIANLEREHEDPVPVLGRSAQRSNSKKKPERHINRGPDGRFTCTWQGCNERVRSFNRKCEWNKHMDKHERPYKCTVAGCEKLPGFTYSGGLARHEREVHGLHNPKTMLNCPHVTCKRYQGKGFTRLENLNEHLRRVHTSGKPVGSNTPPRSGRGLAHNEDDDDDEEEVDYDEDEVEGIDDEDEDEDEDDFARILRRQNQTPAPKTGGKRKRNDNKDDSDALRGEVKRLRQENEDLQKEVESHITQNTQMTNEIQQLRQELAAHHRLQMELHNPQIQIQLQQDLHNGLVERLAPLDDRTAAAVAAAVATSTAVSPPTSSSSSSGQTPTHPRTRPTAPQRASTSPPVLD